MVLLKYASYFSYTIIQISRCKNMLEISQCVPRYDFHTFRTNSRSSHGNIAKLPLVRLSGTDVDTDIQPSQVRPKVTTQVTQDEGTIIVDLNTRSIDMP